MPTPPLVDLPKAFEDARGYIRPLIDEPSGSCQVIYSKKGSIRAAHWHKTDHHFVYLIEGAMDYLHKPAGSDAAPERVRVSAGQMVFTPARTWHRMDFVDHTLMVVLARNPRTQADYEADTVREG